MSRPEFDVRTTPRFDRLFRSLNRRHADLAERFATAIEILRVDPYNRTREHPITTALGNIPFGNWRVFVKDLVSTAFD